MKAELNGSAMVTGASGGIGFAIARMLAEAGYDLTIAGRRNDRLSTAAEELRGFGVRIETFSGDLARVEDVHELADQHATVFGRLDVLINNAGRGIAAPLVDLQDRHVELQLNLNLRAVIHLTKRCLPLLGVARDATGLAQIVNISSVAGKMGQADLSVYSAAKHGVVGFTEALNRELSTVGIRSSVLCPSLVDTPLTEPFRNRIPADEMIAASDVAEAVRYLLGMTRFCLVPEVVLLRAGGSWDE